MPKDKKEKFNSRFSGLIVIIVTSLGLGNIWRFPYLAAEYGGAAFVIAYLVTLVLVVSVGNQCEVLMGKFSGSSIVGAFSKIGGTKFWRICGWVVLCLNCVVMIYYNVLIGWVFRYFFSSFGNQIQNAGSPQAFFDSFIDTPEVILWTLLVNIIIFAVLRLGLKNGLENAAKVLAPVLFLIVIILLFYTLRLPNIEKGFDYYLTPQWKYLLSLETWSQAVAQALWSGVFGWGIMTTMGSYMKKDSDVGTSILVSTILDGGVSWLVGLVIIPACIVYEVPLNSGMNLSFLIMPAMFEEIPYGNILMILFFGALAFSGLGAAIGCVESIVSVFLEEWNISRKKLIPIMFVVWVLASIPVAISKKTLDIINDTIGTYGILVGGFVILIFVGYCWGAERVRKNVLNVGANIEFGRWWSILVKYIAPLTLIISGIGFIKMWLWKDFPIYITLPIVSLIVGFNLLVIYNAIKHPVPNSIGDLSTKEMEKGNCDE